MPCFSLDELWNDDEVALSLNDENDPLASPPQPYPWEKGNTSSHSRYFDLTVPERCQKNSVFRSQTSVEVKRSVPRNSRFIAGSQAKGTISTPSTVGSSQLKGNPRRFSHPLPPPPPTPGADDFEMTGLSGSARRAYNGYWDTKQLNSNISERIKHAADHLLDVLENEEWDILPVIAEPGRRRNTFSSKEITHKTTNLSSSVSLTKLDFLAMQGSNCLEGENFSAVEDEYISDQCKQRYLK